MSEELKVPFGVHKDGTLTHITELTIQENGLACDCTCPKCGGRLMARNKGKKRVAHFAHHASVSCEDAVESALHLFAKEVFERHAQVRVPEHQVIVGWEHETVSAALDVPYVGVVLEQRIGDVIPDVTLTRANGKPPLLVEVAVTHPADEEKRGKLKRLGYPCIEIHLSGMEVGLEEFDREGIEAAIISGEYMKRWLFHPKSDEVEARLRERARKRAERTQREERERKKREEQRQVSRRKKQDAALMPEYQESQKQAKNDALGANTVWIANRKALSIPDDSVVPYYLSEEVKGECLFTVHRTVWQSSLFRSWVFNKQDPSRSRIISVKCAVDNLNEQHPEFFERALYWAHLDRRDVLTPANVVGDYFLFLRDCGFIDEYDGHPSHPLTWQFTCVMPKVVLMPAEYNHHRYLPREDGVFDTETQQDIKF